MEINFSFLRLPSSSPARASVPYAEKLAVGVSYSSRIDVVDRARFGGNRL